MKKELEQQLYNEFPDFFRDVNLSIYESCMAWGIETNDGWFNLIKDMCQQIQNSNPPKDFKFSQIKEKFGQLTVYCDNYNQQILDIIQKFEDESLKICEKCGSMDDVIQTGKWILTLCKQCRKD